MKTDFFVNYLTFSGSNDGTGANYLACFAYDDGINSFNKPVIWQGTKDYFATEVELQANEGILTEKLTTLDNLITSKKNWNDFLKDYNINSGIIFNDEM